MVANQLFTRPLGPFRALAQRVTAHPKAEWLLTRYPVRRWRAIRRWPPVVMLGVFGEDAAQRVHHPDWRVKMALDAVRLAALAAVLAARQRFQVKVLHPAGSLQVARLRARTRRAPAAQRPDNPRPPAPPRVRAQCTPRQRKGAGQPWRAGGSASFRCS